MITALLMVVVRSVQYVWMDTTEKIRRQIYIIKNAPSAYRCKKMLTRANERTDAIADQHSRNREAGPKREFLCRFLDETVTGGVFNDDTILSCGNGLSRCMLFSTPEFQ